MSGHDALLYLLLVPAAALTTTCAAFLPAMRDVYQRLQFTAPAAGLCALLFAAAFWLDATDWAARGKALLVVFLLSVTNGVLTHAIARAARIREDGGLRPRREPP